MKKLFFGSIWMIIFLFIISGLSFAQTPVTGLQPGANVKIVKRDGNIFEGKLLRTIETEYQINTLQKMTVKKFLKDIKKITDTGKLDTGGGAVSEQECTVVCPHCGTPIKVKISK